MIVKLCSFALAALGLLALTGCGTGAQPTALPTTPTAAPAVTRTGTVAMSGTPLAMATTTPGATLAVTTPTAGATMTGSAAITPGSTPATTALPTSTAAAAMTPIATSTVPTGGLAPPEGTPSASAATPAATGTIPTGGLEPPEGTPAATPTGVEVGVTGFNVWQDFMPSTNPGGPPLYASVELNITNHGATPVHAVLATRIVVRRPEGEVLLDRGLQAGPPDTVAGTDLAPGETRHYSYRSASSDVSPTMTENEAVSGSLTVSLDGVEQTVPLPATRVLFTQ